jgi:hypothetical protein
MDATILRHTNSSAKGLYVGTTVRYNVGTTSIAKDAMTEDEAKAILHQYGWIWHIQHRRRGTPYVYAKRRRRQTKNKYEGKYIAPLSKLPELTEADIVAKLTNQPSQE